MNGRAQAIARFLAWAAVGIFLMAGCIAPVGFLLWIPAVILAATLVTVRIRSPRYFFAVVFGIGLTLVSLGLVNGTYVIMLGFGGVLIGGGTVFYAAFGPRTSHAEPPEAAAGSPAGRETGDPSARPAGTAGRYPRSMLAAEQIRTDAQAALKAGDRKRASALRMIQDVLQQEAKLGKGDEVGALQRERKKRMEAADAFADAGRYERAEDERFEAELITAYLPAQLSDAELTEMVREAIDETGASGLKQMGQVMGLLKERVAGRADGKRVSTEVRKNLAS